MGEICSRSSKSSLRFTISCASESDFISRIPSKRMTVHLTRFKASYESPSVVSLAQIKEDQRLTHSPPPSLCVLKYAYTLSAYGSMTLEGHVVKRETNH